MALRWSITAGTFVPVVLPRVVLQHTDEGSLLSYDGASWAAVGGAADPVSFCGMSCLSGCCIETLSPAQSISYKCIGIPVFSNAAGPVSNSPLFTGTKFNACFPIVDNLGNGWGKPFHVSSDGTAIHVGLAYNTSESKHSASSYTAVISKNGGDAYRIRSGTNRNIYITCCSCQMETSSCACMCSLWRGPLDLNRHIPMLSYSGWTDNCNAGYYAHWNCTASDNCLHCGYLVPYASLYNSTCPVYRVCGGTSVIWRTLSMYGTGKRTTCYNWDIPTQQNSNLLTIETNLRGPSHNLFCTGTGLACTEAGFGHNTCGTIMWLTRDPTDLRYYDPSGETRSSLGSGVCGKLQGLFMVNCCTSSCSVLKNWMTGAALEIPSQNMGALWVRLPNTSNNNCCHQLVTWDYGTCCTRIYNPLCNGPLMCCTPWYSQCGNGYRTTQKHPTDNDVYYHMFFEPAETYGTNCVRMCASKFDFSGGTPCWVCNFAFNACVCFNICGSVPMNLHPIYYDLESCGLVSLLAVGQNACCLMRNGWGFVVQYFDFENCTYSVKDYSCINGSTSCGWTKCRSYFCGYMTVCGACTCLDYANFGIGFSPNGRFTTMIWGACSMDFSRGARGDLQSMINKCCARLTHTAETYERTYQTCGSSTNMFICCVPFCSPITCSYSECAINCTFILQCSGTGILCCGGKTKYYFGPRCLDQFCCGPATCAQNTFNRWPVLHDAGYTMGDVMRDYENRIGQDNMSCSITCGSGSSCGSSPP
jgi:hypothetical protein